MRASDFGYVSHSIEGTRYLHLQVKALRDATLFLVGTSRRCEMPWSSCSSSARPSDYPTLTVKAQQYFQTSRNTQRHGVASLKDPIFRITDLRNSNVKHFGNLKCKQIVLYFSFRCIPRDLSKAVYSSPRDCKSHGGHRTKVRHGGSEEVAVEAGKYQGTQEQHVTRRHA
jgi:hypothetical protein